MIWLCVATPITEIGAGEPAPRKGLQSDHLFGMEGRSAIRAYYAAFKERDRQALEGLLVANLRYRSPLGAYDDRDRMLDEIWPAVGHVWAVDLEIFGAGPAYMVRYRHNIEGSPTLVEYFHFQESRITEIEVYVDRLPERF